MTFTPEPDFDQELADSYVGKMILVGITYYDSRGKELGIEQKYGIIASANPEGVTITLQGKDNAGKSWTMAPLLEAIEIAEPGFYVLTNTGEQVEDPDLIARWRVTKPPTH